MKISGSWLGFAVLISICLIGILDYWIALDVSLSICYLIPIAIATRYVGKRTGVILAILSSLFWFIAETSAKADLFYLLIVWNTLVRLIVFLVVVHLLSALNKAYKKEKTLASVDPLTKIYNRRYFLEILKTETKRSIRYERSLTLAYFDVDNFKKVNDNYGHDWGDRLLCLIADTVKQSIRETDVFARMGGDEFVLLLPENNYHTANIVLRRVQQQLADAVRHQDFSVGFSIGAVTFTSFPDSTARMLKEVDSLMYEVKNNQKNALEHRLFEIV